MKSNQATLHANVFTLKQLNQHESFFLSAALQI